MEPEIIGCTSAGFEEKDGKYTAFEKLQKHVYFINETSIERTKRKFIERFIRKLPIEELERIFNFKMEDVELDGQYKEGSNFSCELCLSDLFGRKFFLTSDAEKSKLLK